MQIHYQMLKDDRANGLSDLNWVSQSPRGPAAYHISVNEELQHLSGSSLLKIWLQYYPFVAKKKRECFITFASTANRLRRGKLPTTIMPPHCFLIPSIFSLSTHFHAITSMAPWPRCSPLAWRWHIPSAASAFKVPSGACGDALGPPRRDWGFQEQGVGLRSSQPPELF